MSRPTTTPCKSPTTTSLPKAVTPSVTSAGRPYIRPALSLLSLPATSRFSPVRPTGEMREMLSPIASSPNLYRPSSPQLNGLAMRHHEVSIMKLKRTVDRLRRSLRRLISWRLRMLKLLCLNDTDAAADLFKDPPCVPLPLRDETEFPVGYNPVVGKQQRIKKRERVNGWILKNEPSLRLVVTICGVIAAGLTPLMMFLLAA